MDDEIAGGIGSIGRGGNCPDLDPDDAAVPDDIDGNPTVLCHVEETAVETGCHDSPAIAKHLGGLCGVFPPDDIVADGIELLERQPQPSICAEQAIDLFRGHAFGQQGPFENSVRTALNGARTGEPDRIEKILDPGRFDPGKRAVVECHYPGIGVLRHGASIGSGGGDVASTLTISLGAFLAYIGVQWWASWYPGAEPGGGGYVAQRMMSTKNERHATGATLFFQIAHYAIRPWPWILVALATLVLYPGLGEGEERLGYVMAIRDYLPPGLTGLLLVAMLAAYMSTISTQLNWGASFIVNDFYKRFLYKLDDAAEDNTQNTGERHYVLVSRVVTILIMLISLYVTTIVTSITQVWHFLLECGAGLGLVLILRWCWQRVNAWSEITATIVPFIVFAVAKYGYGLVFPESFFITVGITTAAWLLVTFFTPRTRYEVLRNFYSRVQPPGMWTVDADTTREKNKRIPRLIACWLSSILFTYSVLFMIGKIIFMEWLRSGMWFALALIGFFVFRGSIKKLYTKSTPRP